VTISQSGVGPFSLVLTTLQKAQGSAAVSGTNSFTNSLTSKVKTPVPVH
jgi:hypothetical protein